MDITQHARELLARRGIDPDNVPTPEPPDLATTLVENATIALEVQLPSLFLNAVPDHPDVRAWVRRFLDDRHTAGSLLLLGSTGVGKTHQAVGALRGCVLGAAKACRPVTWQFTTHPALNAALRPQYDDGHLTAYDTAEHTDLLVLDDLGAGKNTDWTADTLYRLIDARWSNQRPMIATTNLGAEALRDAVGDRIASRLRAGTVVALAGQDRRRGGGAQ